MDDYLIKVNEYLDFVFSYGPFWVYALIFIACFIENIFPPFPGDSFIVGAGALSAVGRLDFVLSYIIVVAGGMSSVLILYLLGNKFGRDFFIRKNYKYLTSDDIVKTEKRFGKYGAVLLLASRFVVGFRVILALVAGIGRYPIWKMITFSSISYIMFAGLLLYGAVKLVEHLDTLQNYFKMYNMIIWPIVITIFTVFIVFKIRKVRTNR